MRLKVNRGSVLVLLPAIISVVVTCIVRHGNPGIDDAFISYRFASNVAHGFGFVWNPGEAPVYGFSTALWVWILSLLGALGMDIPTAGRLLDDLSRAAAAGLLSSVGASWGRPWGGFAAALAYGASPTLILTGVGMETNLFVALMLAAVYLSAKDRPVGYGFAGSLCGIVRPEGFVLLLGLLAADAVRHRRIPLRALAAALLPALAWLIWAYATFGYVVPLSGRAKMAYVKAKPTISGKFGLQGLLSGILPMRAWAGQALLALVALGVWGAVKSRRRDIAAVVGVWALVDYAFYLCLGFPNFSHYYLAMIVAVLLLSAVGVASLTRRSALLAGLVICWLAGILYVHWTGNWQARRDVGLGVARDYRSTGEWIALHSQQDASVAAMEVGYIGYYSQRRVIDCLGLVSPEIEKAIRPGSNWIQWVLEAYQPDYIFAPEQSTIVRLAADRWKRVHVFVDVRGFRQGVYERKRP